MKMLIKDFLKIIRNLFMTFIFYLIFFSYKIIYGKKLVLCECYMHTNVLFFRKQNWGDDLNKYLFEYVSKIKILSFPFSKIRKNNHLTIFSLIGSILTFYRNDNKIIYGSGIIDPKKNIFGQPKKIISVRGPRTRGILIEKGIDCPVSYGDPVLLLPVFYKNNSIKTQTGGIILNMGTELKQLDLLNTFIKKYNLKVISMTHYKKWTDVIDDICSCKYIISESLHGLIVAETYGIPNVWVEFKDHSDYWNFKFYDFFESIGKNEKILKINTENDITDALKKINTWKKGNIDYNDLIKKYPFDIKIKLQNTDILEQGK